MANSTSNGLQYNSLHQVVILIFVLVRLPGPKYEFAVKAGEYCALMQGFRVRSEAAVNATLCFVVRFNEDINQTLKRTPLSHPWCCVHSWCF